MMKHDHVVIEETGPRINITLDSLLNKINQE